MNELEGERLATSLGATNPLVQRSCSGTYVGGEKPIGGDYSANEHIALEPKCLRDERIGVTKCAHVDKDINHLRILLYGLSTLP